MNAGISGIFGGSGSYIALICAELFLVLTHTREITILVKNDSQRDDVERQEARNGLARSLLLEIFLYLPSSVALVLIVVRPMLSLLPIVKMHEADISRYAFYGLLGILSYQFPFATVRKIVMRITLNTIQTFAEIVVHPETTTAASIAQPGGEKR